MRDLFTEQCILKLISGEKVHIRWMITPDLQPVLKIEESKSFSWSEKDFIHCSKQKNCILMIAEKGEEIFGFIVFEICEHCFRILNFAVREDVRKKGIGTKMIANLISKLSPARRHSIVMEVRETNLTCQLFLKFMGF